MEGSIDNPFGGLWIGSEYSAEERLVGIRASAEKFKYAVETTAIEVAVAATDHLPSAWSEWRGQYPLTVPEDSATASEVVIIGYGVEDTEETQEVLREAITAYRNSFEDPDGLSGIKAVINVVNGSIEVLRQLREFSFRNSSTVQCPSVCGIMAGKDATSDPEELLWLPHLRSGNPGVYAGEDVMSWFAPSLRRRPLRDITIQPPP